MRKTREEKAITLIALIITIVVLLILAVVAINAVTGDGIIQHATNAKTEYEKAQTDEEMMLSSYETYLKGNVDTWDGESKKIPITKDGNWYIYTCSEFKFFADFVNGELTDKEKEGLEINENTTIYLMSNLDLGAKETNGVWSGTEWEAVGKDTDHAFAGIFEGNNHYIEGVYIDKETGSFAGIFGRSTNTIKNLTIKDGYIENNGSGVGGIAGRAEKIINCHNINATVKINAGSYYAIGGIVGIGRTTENCTNSGTIIIEGMIDSLQKAGGIVGQIPSGGGSIKNCKNLSNIECTGDLIGGIVGYANLGANIDGCVNVGDISGANNVGGLIGCAPNDENTYINITNCYNTGDIKGAGQIGGIIGNISLTTNRTVKACYSTGKVEGQELNGTGAIIGWTQTISNTDNIQSLYYLNTEESTVKGIGNIADTVDSVKIAEGMSENDMKKTEFVTLLNTITNTDAWVGSDGQYPRLKWEK